MFTFDKRLNSGIISGESASKMSICFENCSFSCPDSRSTYICLLEYDSPVLTVLILLKQATWRMFPAHHNSLLFILRLTCCLASSPWNLKQAHLGVLSFGENWGDNQLFRQTLLYLECITSILQLWLHSWGMQVGPWKGLGDNFHCTEHSLNVGIELSVTLFGRLKTLWSWHHFLADNLRSMEFK